MKPSYWFLSLVLALCSAVRYFSPSFSFLSSPQCPFFVFLALYTTTNISEHSLCWFGISFNYESEERFRIGKARSFGLAPGLKSVWHDRQESTKKCHYQLRALRHFRWKVTKRGRVGGQYLKGFLLMGWDTWDHMQQCTRTLVLPVWLNS